MMRSSMVLCHKGGEKSQISQCFLNELVSFVMLAAMKCMISCQDLTFLKGMKRLSHLLECEPCVVGSNLVFQNGSWAPCYLYSLNKRAFFKLWEARYILCFFSIQNNLLLTTITLLPNIQVSKLSVKKGEYLLGFCKSGRFKDTVSWCACIIWRQGC